MEVYPFCNKSMPVYNGAFGAWHFCDSLITLFQSFLVPKNVSETDILPNRLAVRRRVQKLVKALH